MNLENYSNSRKFTTKLSNKTVKQVPRQEQNENDWASTSGITSIFPNELNVEMLWFLEEQLQKWKNKLGFRDSKIGGEIGDEKEKFGTRRISGALLF